MFGWKRERQRKFLKFLNTGKREEEREKKLKEQTKMRAHMDRCLIKLSNS